MSSSGLARGACTGAGSRQKLFVLTLDSLQRRLAQEALSEGGAPFDASRPGGFRQGVRKVWEIYQGKRRSFHPHPAAALHLTDRLVYERKREEWIDDPNLPDKVRTRMIRNLDRVNRALGAYLWFFAALRRVLRDAPDGNIRLLDIGSGHGAFPIRLAKKGKLAGRSIEVIGSDIVPAYVEAAREAARDEGARVEFRVLNALKLDRMKERFDVITCTQTIHHFPPDFLAELMVRARANARHAVLFFDARRAPWSVAGVALLAVAVTRDPGLVHDGVISIRRMYSPAELEMLANCSPGGEAFRARRFGPMYVIAEARTV